MAVEPNHGPIVLIIFSRENNGLIHIPLFRITKSSLAPTIARRILLEVIGAVYTRNTVLHLDDPYAGEVVFTASRELGFFSAEAGLIKICLPVISSFTGVTSKIDLMLNGVSKHNVFTQSDPSDAINMIQLEKMAWPVKVTHTEIPCFIVPIRPQWAQHLFDSGLAKHNLFPIEDVALNLESVFYRSSKAGRGIQAPARILWYVSGHKNYPSSKALRACSYLEEIIIDKPKNLYRQFRRLGVYNWQDICKMVDGDLDKKIMAIRFGFTESFLRPLKWSRLKDIFGAHGQVLNIESPKHISNNLFVELYREAKYGVEGE